MSFTRVTHPGYRLLLLAGFRSPFQRYIPNSFQFDSQESEQQLIRHQHRFRSLYSPQDLFVFSGSSTPPIRGPHIFFFQETRYQDILSKQASRLYQDSYCPRWLGIDNHNFQMDVKCINSVKNPTAMATSSTYNMSRPFNFLTGMHATTL